MARGVSNLDGAAQRGCDRYRDVTGFQCPRASETAGKTRQNALPDFDRSCGARNGIGSGGYLCLGCRRNGTPPKKLRFNNYKLWMRITLLL